MTNLEPAEQAEFERRCARQRERAREFPCWHIGQSLQEAYKFHLGPWNFVLTLDRYIKPVAWHGTVSLLEDLGEERITDEQGRYLFDAPRVGMQEAKKWDNETYQNARDLLGLVFGPIIRTDTKIFENRLGFAMHWLIPFDGSIDAS